MGARDVGEGEKVGVRQPHAVGKNGQTVAGAPQRLGIAVEPEQTDVVARPAQHRFRVSTHAHRPVDDPARAARSQKERDLVDEGRNVNR